MHLLYSVPDIWGRGGELPCLSFLLRYMFNNTDIRGKVEPRRGPHHRSVSVTGHGLPPTPSHHHHHCVPFALWEKVGLFFCKREVCNGKGGEKADGSGSCHIRPGHQEDRRGCERLLHSLRATTCACSAGHCHRPDSRRCSGSARPSICTPARAFIQMFRSLSIHPSWAMCDENSEPLTGVRGVCNSSRLCHVLHLLKSGFDSLSLDPRISVHVHKKSRSTTTTKRTVPSEIELILRILSFKLRFHQDLCSLQSSESVFRLFTGKKNP